MWKRIVAHPCGFIEWKLTQVGHVGSILLVLRKYAVSFNWRLEVGCGICGSSLGHARFCLRKQSCMVGAKPSIYIDRDCSRLESAGKVRY